MTLHLDELESRVLSISPGDEPDLSEAIMARDLGETVTTPGNEPQTSAPVELELISQEAFAEQWGQMHDLFGGMVQMRTGAPCPLGSQARNEGGMVACAAAYALLSSNPATAKIFLSPNSTYLGQLAALGLHGFACVQMVKAAREAGERGTISAKAA